MRQYRFDTLKHSANGSAECGVCANFSQTMNPSPRNITATVMFAATVLMFSFAGCQKLRDNFRPDELDLYKIPFPTEDYTLENSGCDWDFNNLTRDSIYVVNSDSELMALVSCSGSSMPPEVDFDRYSLLLVHGNTDYGSVLAIDKSLKPISKNNYKLNVEMRLNETSPSQLWQVAVLVPKLPQNSHVELSLYYHYMTVWKCFFEDSLRIGGLAFPLQDNITITLTMDTLLNDYYISTSPQSLNFSPDVIFFFRDSIEGKYSISEKKVWNPDTMLVEVIAFSSFSGVPLNAGAFVKTMFSSDSMQLQHYGGFTADKIFPDYLFIKQSNF